MTTFYYWLAIVCFSAAVYEDWPFRANHPELPDRQNRAVGNFFCSLGFLFIAIAHLFGHV